jgi:O-antigen/teichoic acid export membrane protein
MVLVLTYTAVGAATFLAADLLSNLVFDTGEHADLIRLAAGSLALSSLSITPLTFVRVRERSTLFVTVQLCKMALQVGLNLLFLVEMEMGARGVFLSNLIANGIVGAALAGYLLRHVGVHFTRAATRDLLRYGIPLIGTQFATFVATFGDRYFLQNAADSTTVGLYTLAYQFGFLLAAVGYMPFEMIWEPVRFDIARRADRDAVYSRGFIYLNLMLVTIAVGLALLIQDVLHLMTTPAFYPAAQFVPLILVAYVFQGWTGFQDVGIHMKERTELITLANWIAAGIAVVGYAIFIPRYLGMGAAGVTVVAFFARYFGVYLASQRLWRVEYEWGPVFRLIAIALAVVFAGTFVPADTWYVSIGAKLVLMGVFVGAVLSARVLPEGDLERGLAMARSALASRAT